MLYVDIDIAGAVDNLKYLKSRTDGKICAVVKADAYGHGIKFASFIEEYVDGFAVATQGEAIKLNKLGINKPIFILCPSLDIKRIYPNFVYTVTSVEQLTVLKALPSPFVKYVAIKCNTGMNRLGVGYEDFKEMLGYIYASRNLELVAVFTHFYNGTHQRSAAAQLRRFKPFTSEVSCIKSCAASSFLRLPAAFGMDMVRTGLAMYGYGDAALKPVMSAYSDIIQITRVKKGEHIGYGNCLAKRDMTLATLAVGYADGYRRLTHPRWAAVRGDKVRVMSVCMDMSIVDVTRTPVTLGDKVYILGGGVGGEELAQSYGTIVYEVLTAIKGDRVRRKYVF